MSIRALQAVRRLPLQGTHLPTNMRFILFLLADFANEDDDAWPNYSTLELQTGMHRSTIIRAINELVERGLIAKMHRSRNDGSQSSNTYHLTFVPKEDAEEALRVKRPTRATMTQGSRTQRPGGMPSATPGYAQRDPMNYQITLTQTPTTTTPLAPKLDATPTLEEDELPIIHMAETEDAQRAAQRRHNTRHSANLLAQQHPRVWHAFTDLAAIYPWKTAQFAVIAERILTLAREHTDTRVETAIRTVLETGATITHPIAYINKLLTLNDTPTNSSTPRRSLRDGLTPLDSITLD